MTVLPVCMYMYYICDWCPRRSEEGVKSLRTGVTDDYEPQSEC